MGAGVLAVALIYQRFFVHLFNRFNQRKYGKAEQDGYENQIHHLFALLLSWKAPIIGTEVDEGNRMIPQAGVTPPGTMPDTFAVLIGRVP